MELKAYLAVLINRWIFVVLVPAIVLIAVAYQAIQSEPTYTATTRASIIRLPQQDLTDDFRFDGYYRYLSSEFAVDDLVELTQGNVFAEDVAQFISLMYEQDITAGEIQQSIRSERQHRILTMNVESKDPVRAVMIAQAATERLERRGTAYFGLDAEGESAVETIQRPLSASSSSSREMLIYTLQLAVALFAGVALAYLVEYLDDTIRSPETLTTALDLPVIGTIPAERGRT